jgi:hypothetical protein
MKIYLKKKERNVELLGLVSLDCLLSLIKPKIVGNVKRG